MKLEDVPLQFLREITDGFSEGRKLRAGAFGVVYKGVTKNGDDVAVKKLLNVNLDYKQFQNEIYNLQKLKHRNIVHVLGYCYETEQKPFIMPDGSKVFVDETCGALCLEYLHNGSLQGHLSDEFCGLDWHTRFKIIKGTCEGLKYLHEELDEPIYHLDLKPDNILLDKDMVPKIADFGLSKIFSKDLTRTTQSPYGTLGYQPPEYIDRGEISGKFDIFSLGVVMIRIVSGPKGYPKCLDMSSDEFTDQVRKNWRNRLQATCRSNNSLEAYCHQVETCTQIALNCVEEDSQKRPNIVDITEKLNVIETGIVKLPQKGCRKPVSRMTIHNTKIEMRKETKDITGRHQKINLMTGPNRSELEFDARETSSDVLEELIVGRTEEKVKIIASLLEGMPENIIILPIYGIGGIGKTTFARLIYNDPKFKGYSQVWVNVSQIFDLNKIRESIISQLSGKVRQDHERQMIHSCLTKLLSGEKILIVLDDLWEDNQFQLQELKDMLYHDDSNIIILVTTRSERVAKRICTNLQPYKILPLTDDMCWDIIKQRSGFEARDDKEQLMGIGSEIAQKCGGVALAARSIGFTLRSMHFDQWIKLKDNDIWNEPVSNDVSLPNHVLASLKLSYSYMDLCLKPCFTYCAIFPKGHKIVKNDLIYQWLSLDFIKPTKILSNMQLCENYIVQLLGLSFFQHSVSPKTVGTYYEVYAAFTMHDLVHDLARSVMVNEILDASKQSNIRGCRIQYALLNDCTMSLETFTQCPNNIRALHFLESDKTVLHGASSSLRCLSFLVCGKIGLHDHVFSSAKYLRVMDLSECCILNLPNSIGNLKQLRYLNAPRIQHEAVPKFITKLTNLIHLSLCGSSKIWELPKSIGKMERLTYLDLSGCCAIYKLPVSFSKLKELVHLDLSNCSHFTDISECLKSLTNLEYLNLSCSFYVTRISNAEAFFTLTKLEYLNLAAERSRIKNLPQALSRLTNIEYLNLSGVVSESLRSDGPITFGNLKNLVFLDLSRSEGLHGILEAFGSLTKLQYLNLSECLCFGVGAKLHLARMSEIIGNLTELVYLNLSGCSNYMKDQEEFFIFLQCISNLQNLEHLDLSHNYTLRSLPDYFCSLKKLQVLDLSGCRNLQSLPAVLDEIDSLKSLGLKDCSKKIMWEQRRFSKSLLTLPYFLVLPDCHDSGSNLVVLRDVNRTDQVEAGCCTWANRT